MSLIPLLARTSPAASAHEAKWMAKMQTQERRLTPA